MLVNFWSCFIHVGGGSFSFLPNAALIQQEEQRQQPSHQITSKQVPSIVRRRQSLEALPMLISPYQRREDVALDFWRPTKRATFHNIPRPPLVRLSPLDSSLASSKGSPPTATPASSLHASSPETSGGSWRVASFACLFSGRQTQSLCFLPTTNDDGTTQASITGRGLSHSRTITSGRTSSILTKADLPQYFSSFYCTNETHALT